MSVRVMTAVWAIDLPDSEKLVLLALADCANDEGHCWPSMASLSRKCSKGERTVQGCIQSLVKQGHITREEVRGKGCNYLVHPRSDCTPAKSAPPQRLHPRREQHKPPQPLRPTPAAAADKPSKNHNKPSSKGSAARNLILPDWLNADDWKAFVEMRRSIPRAPFTDEAARRLVVKLGDLRGEGYCPAKLLARAIESGWRTVFPHDDCKAGSRAKPAEHPFYEIINARHERRVAAGAKA